MKTSSESFPSYTVPVLTNICRQDMKPFAMRWVPPGYQCPG